MNFNIFMFVKVCSKQEYCEDFLDGRLYMNTLKYFREFEDLSAANIADHQEASNLMLQPSKVTVTIGSHVLNPADFSGPIYIHDVDQGRLNILCVYAVHNKDFPVITEVNFSQFTKAQLIGPEVHKLGLYAVVVYDPQKFIERVIAAADREKIEIEASLVNYVDEDSYHDSAENNRAVFFKRDRYSHQREGRFVVNRGSAPVEPFVLEIGNIRDICELVPINVVNQIIKDELEKTKDPIIASRSSQHNPAAHSAAVSPDPLQ